MTAVAALLMPGCRSPEQVRPAGARPHYANPRKDIRMVGRIILVEPANLSAHPRISADFTDALSQAIKKKNLFGQIVIYRGDPLFAKHQLGCETCPPEIIKEVQQAFAADAILTGVIRDYQAHPRLAISVRLRLTDLADGELIWAMEQVWDTTDKEIEKRMRGFFETEMGSGYEPLNWRIGLISPHIFNKFVCYEIGETLAPR